MAVFKATSYTKSKKHIKASVRYIRERLGKNREKITRELFNQDGPLDKKQFFRIIDNADEGTFFYRFMISPDPKMEDTFKDLDLREITEQTMAFLEEKLKGLQKELQFVAAIHDDHRPHRHVHALALLTRRLNVTDLSQLRDAATEAALSQRQELDLARQQSREQTVRISAPLPGARTSGASITAAREEGARQQSTAAKHAQVSGHACPRCRPATAMKKLAENVHWCPTCHYTLKQDFKLELKSEEAQWEL